MWASVLNKQIKFKHTEDMICGSIMNYLHPVQKNVSDYKLGMK